MNDHEQHQVGEIVARFDRWAWWFRWAAGGLLAVLSAGFIFAMEMESRQSTTEQVSREQGNEIERLSERVEQARISDAQLGAELSGLAAQLAAQGEMLNRIDNSLSELTRYLRDRRGIE